MTATSELLTVDCGNSTITCRRQADGASFSTDSMAPDIAALRAFAGGCSRAIIVSVVEAAVGSVAAALAAAGVAVDIVGEDLQCPMRLVYDTPGTLGADRWLGAFAAHRAFGAAVTIDCGTATTINVVDGDGAFHGGAIAPGLAAFVAGMQQRTPALPAANLDADVHMPAPSTQQSVDAGVLLGWAGLVERLVREARKTIGDDAAIVVTGGNAERLLRLVDLRVRHVPDLLHDGMRALAGIAS